MVKSGSSFAAIREAVEQHAGGPVSEAVVTAYLSRVALTACTTHRYFDTVPWRVRPEHTSAEQARMLRLLARRRDRFPISDGQNSTLDAWLATLGRDRLVVAYSPILEDGFAYVDESLRQGPHRDVPIRVPVLTFDELEALPRGT